MNEWALAWCLRNKAVTSVIPGCKNRATIYRRIHVIHSSEKASLQRAETYLRYPEWTLTRESKGDRER